jgi:hypothetical protein
MNDRQRKPKQPSPLLLRIDRVCARMNGGLAAVAIALAILVTLTAAIRAPTLLAGTSFQHVKQSD